MLEVLLDGTEHAAGSLALAAGITAATATQHLDRLEERGLVASRRLGRHRLVRLAGPSVARACEALGELATPAKPNGLRASTRREQMRAARTCYDHLAGRLGVGIADAAVEAGALHEDFSLADDAPTWFARLGVDLDVVRRPGSRALLVTESGAAALPAPGSWTRAAGRPSRGHLAPA